MQILAISGSLRAASSNTAVLEAAGALAPAGMVVSLYSGLGDLPAFNPDLEGSEPPAVLDFRARLRGADGVLICSPEYAHGVPGALKNALDWVVSSGEFVNKPVALLNASAFAVFARTSLTETLTVIGARLSAPASVILPLTSNRIDAAGILAHPQAANVLRGALTVFRDEIIAGL